MKLTFIAMLQSNSSLDVTLRRPRGSAALEGCVHDHPSRLATDVARISG